MLSAQVITQVYDQVWLADCLLMKSGELLKVVVELGSHVASAADSLNGAVGALHQTDGRSADTEAMNLRANQAVIDKAKGVVQLSAETALSIRRVIGWNDHPYFPEQRNGENTLIGIERALIQLSVGANALASSDFHENFFTQVHQRIRVMGLAAEKNTRSATANAVAVETVGAMAIKISRAYQTD